MKNILILDTETTLDIKSPLIYDLAFIALVNGVVIKENYLIKEVFNTIPLMDTAYYKNKRPKYFKLKRDNKIEPISFQKAIRKLMKFIKKNRIEIIGAYNIAFDIRAINNTCRILDSELFEKNTFNKLIEQKNKKVLCLWHLACCNLLNTDDYRNFAEQHQFKSTKGNFETNAEVAYAFIKNQPKFIEDHLALSDCEIEMEIYEHIMKLEKPKIEFGKKYGSWRKVQVKKT